MVVFRDTAIFSWHRIGSVNVQAFVQVNDILGEVVFLHIVYYDLIQVVGSIGITLSWRPSNRVAECG